MVPSPKLVTNANLPSPVITAQHTSVRVLPTVPVTEPQLAVTRYLVGGRGGLAGRPAERFGDQYRPG